MYKFAIIEDDRTNSDSFKESLEKGWPGCTVKQYYTTDSAVQAIQAEDFDLVVSDLNLGEGLDQLGGFRIAKLVDFVKCPLLIVSGSPQHQVHGDSFRALGAWEFLLKPVDEPDFLAEVEAALAVRNEQTGATPHGSETLKSLPDVPQLTIDLLAKPIAHWNGNPLYVTVSQLRVAHALASKKNQIIEYADLYNLFNSGRNLKNLRVVISKLKVAFKEAEEGFNKISLVSGTGYVWRD